MGTGVRHASHVLLFVVEENFLELLSLQAPNKLSGPTGKMAVLADILPGLVIATNLHLKRKNTQKRV